MLPQAGARTRSPVEQGRRRIGACSTALGNHASRGAHDHARQVHLQDSASGQERYSDSEQERLRREPWLWACWRFGLLFGHRGAASRANLRRSNNGWRIEHNSMQRIGSSRVFDQRMARRRTSAPDEHCILQSRSVFTVNGYESITSRWFGEKYSLKLHSEIKDESGAKLPLGCSSATSIIVYRPPTHEPAFTSMDFTEVVLQSVVYGLSARVRQFPFLAMSRSGSQATPHSGQEFESIVGSHTEARNDGPLVSELSDDEQGYAERYVGRVC
jgi:hypothetical protein